MKRVKRLGRGRVEEQSKTAVLEAFLGKKRLPEKVMERFKGAVEGKLVPRLKTGLPSEKFLGSLSDVSRKKILDDSIKRLHSFIELDVPAFIIERELSLLLPRLSQIMDMAGKSSAPVSYMRFLAREELPLSSFLESIGIFPKRRKISFNSIEAGDRETGLGIFRAVMDNRLGGETLYEFLCEEMLRIIREDFELEDGDDITRDDLDPGQLSAMLRRYGLFYDTYYGELYRYHQYFEMGQVRGYQMVLSPQLLEKNVSGLAFGMDFLLISDALDVAQDSFQKMFLESTILQHELQHIFDTITGTRTEGVDNEYRARLAELVFSGWNYRYDAACSVTPEEIAQAREVAGNKTREQIAILANARIQGLLGPEKKTGMWEYSELKEAAMRELNMAYKEICGLSYDQIIEPLMKR